MADKTSMDLIEPAFGQNNFRKPKLLTGYEVILQSVLMILFGKPGCYPSIPDLGMNIQQYRMQRLDTIAVGELESTLRYQCGILRDGWVDSDISMVKVQTSDLNEMLLITIPVINDSDNFSLIVGIAERDNQVVYNYELVNEMLSPLSKQQGGK